MNQRQHTAPTEVNNCNLVYILHLASLVFGVTGLIALIMSYVNRNDAPQWLQSHYQYLRRRRLNFDIFIHMANSPLRKRHEAPRQA